MKRKNNVFRMLVSGLLAASLLAGPAQAADPEIRVSSCKGNTLAVGERSGLIIGPSGAEYTASSSAPETVAVEQVLTFWVAVAKAPGTATISVKNNAGATGSLTLTVSSVDAKASPENTLDLSANMDIRLKMVEYINQTRRENGLAELPIDESLMNAAQDVSSQCVSEHRPYDHMALLRYGWPHGGMYNLIAIDVNSFPDIARKAVTAWINSPGHFQTMLMEEASCVGAGVTIRNGTAYTYMVVGDPTSHNPYEE